MTGLCESTRGVSEAYGRTSRNGMEDRLVGRVARFADRREDWTVFGFETALDPRYARAQRR